MNQIHKQPQTCLWAKGLNQISLSESFRAIITKFTTDTFTKSSHFAVMSDSGLLMLSVTKTTTIKNIFITQNKIKKWTEIKY